MEIFTKKSIVLKIVIALVIVILFNFSAPTISQATSAGDVIGGTLLAPIVDLLLAVSDGLMYLIQRLVLGMDSSLTKVSTEIGDTLPAVLAFVVGAAIVIGTAIITGGVSLIVGAVAIAASYATYKLTAEALPPTFYLPMYAISPEEIFTNQIALLDVNFFNPHDYQEIVTQTGVTSSEQISSASMLSSTIATWYVALRNLALIVLLSVLLYTGIRIVISSAVQDRAKYKEKLFNWLIAICLLFFMQYIMSFAMTMVETLSEGINSVNSKIKIELPDLQSAGYKIEVVSEEPGSEGEIAATDANTWFMEQGLLLDSSGNPITSGGDDVTGNYVWYTNLMGKVRLDMQLIEPEQTDDNEVLKKMGYTVLFLILVFYTVAFLVVYVKRLIMLAFLTMIAPLVAMTYSLDKMKDGSAQALNLWFKEYIFNLLIQPFHLILYTMLVGTAMEFASNNLIYSIVALGFIFQGEKLLRKFFGFESASTIESGSAIGGALAMAGIGLLKRATGGVKKGLKGGANTGTGETAKAIRQNRTNQLLDSGLQKQDVKNEKDATYQRNRMNTQETGTAQNISDKKGGSGESKSRELYRRSSNEQTDSDNPPPPPEPPTPPEAQTTEGNSNIIYDRYGHPKSWTQDDTRGMGQWARDTWVNSEAYDNLMHSKPIRFIKQRGEDAREIAEKISRGVGKIPKPIRNTIRGVTAVAGKGIKYAAPKLARGYARGILAGTAGLAGVAAGLASDDDKNILKYGATGLGAGWIAGGGAINMTDDAMQGVNEVMSTYNEAANGIEAEHSRQIAIEERAAMRDQNRRKLYREELGLKNSAEIKKAMEDSRKYRENGIMDDKLIIKAMKADGFGDRDSKERMILAGLATQVGNDNKKIEDLKKRLYDRGFEDKDINKYIDGIRKITGAI